MKLLSVTIACTFLLYSETTLARPSSNRVVHERRSKPTEQRWIEVARASAEQPLLLRIGLGQQNLHRAGEFTFDVAHPDSINYGRHWVPQQVIDMFAASDEAIDATVKWLVQEGVEPHRIALTSGRNWLKVNTMIGEAERILHATYNIYEDDQGLQSTACEDYSIPADLQEHIDFITPTVQLYPHKPAQELRSEQLKRDIALSGRIKAVNPPSVNSALTSPDCPSLANCANLTTPACLRALYNIPKATETVEGNSFGIIELSPQSFNQADLDAFYSTYTKIPNGTAPIFDGIDSGYLSPGSDTGTRGESNLDLSYALALTYPQNVTLFQTGDGDLSNPATFNNFLDAIDGSYCTYEGGDDPNWDAKYPNTDPYYQHDYSGQPECGNYQPTWVISGSYGVTEWSHPDSYFIRQCNEYMKLTLMGVSVIFSSGDTGVAGVAGKCINPDVISPGGQPDESGHFSPLFPASCPWVTAVGATAIPEGGTVKDPEEAKSGTDNDNGGGFSNIFAMPDYQQETVANWLANYPPPYNSSKYNTTGSRAFPDVSANGKQFATYVGGTLYSFTGTSAAAPTFASMIVLINGERIKAGKKPIGFLNPILYAHPEIFNDITVGNNAGCGTQGFSASPGWDPVTGLGTPNFPKLREVLLSQP